MTDFQDMYPLPEKLDPNEPYRPPSFKEVTLEKMKVAIQQGLDMRLLANTKVDVFEYGCDFGRIATAKIEGFIFSEKLDSFTVDLKERYPVDWWEAFKERWFPKRWLRRWPVKYKEQFKTLEFDLKVIYPKYHHKVSVPEELHYFRIMRKDYD